MASHMKFAIWLSLVSLILTCSLSSSTQAQRRKKASTVPPKKPAKPLTPDDEALALGNQAIKAVFTQCGDSWYHVIGYELYESKGLELIVSPYNVSSVDQLNGIQWNGRISITAKVAFRFYDFGTSKWSRWHGPNVIPSGAIRFTLKKVNGKWSFQPFKDSWNGKWLTDLSEALPKEHKVHQVNCDAIPKVNPSP